MSNRQLIIAILAILVIIFIRHLYYKVGSYFSFTTQAHAQSGDGTVDGSIPPKETPSGSADTGTSTPEEPTNPPTEAEPAPSSTTPKPPTTPKVTPKPTPVSDSTSAIVSPSEPVVLEPEPSSGNSLLPFALGGVALGLLGFFGLKIKNKKKSHDKDDSKCLNFKKLMEEKLDELKDLKAQLHNLIKDKTREQIKEITAETPAGKLFVAVEETEKALNKLKDLYEKCITSFSIPKTTLLFLYKPEEKKILLGMKKRRFGEGKWNGLGGKLLKGESVRRALVRETKEEVGVSVKEDDMKQVATLDFAFKDNPEWNQQTHVFLTEKWEGEPEESEEMLPAWYDVDAIPFDKMWVDDIHWLPRVLEGENISASFMFDKQGSKILDMKVEKNAKN